MAQNIQKMLPKLEVFKFLDEADCKTIEKYMFSYEYKDGNYVFKEGTHGGYMFFIVDGTVDVIKQIDTQKTKVATLGAGRSVGEMSLIDGGTRSATVKATSDLSLIVLKREDFQKLLDEEPVIANKVLMGIAKLLSDSLRETTNEFTERMLSLC